MKIPEKPPNYIAARLDLRKDVWQRLAQAILLIGQTGISLRIEIAEKLAAGWDITPGAGSLKQLLERTLPQTGLIEQTNLHLIGPSQVTVLCLSNPGEALCRSLGMVPVLSEWERMKRHHAGDKQGHHTAAVLAFAYHARRRGWQVSVLPEIHHHSRPDMRITLPGQNIYVEVELGDRKWDKWRAQEDLQGFAAICALTPARRRQLVKECQGIDIPGMATDLETLSKNKRHSQDLWCETWQI